MFVGDVWDACHDIYVGFVVGTTWMRDARYGSTSQFSKRSTWGYILNEIVASYRGSEAPASTCCDEDIYGLEIQKVQSVNVSTWWLMVACYRRSGRGRDMSLEVKFGKVKWINTYGISNKLYALQVKDIGSQQQKFEKVKD